MPACLQPLLRDKIAALAATAELAAAPREGTPLAYRHYVRARDAGQPPEDEDGGQDE